jgi:hypothetical protein
MTTWTTEDLENARKKIEEEEYIMAFSSGFAQTSPMTTFKHIKNLTKRKLLKLEQSPTDGRVKFLKEGVKYKELVKYLGEQ